MHGIWAGKTWTMSGVTVSKQEPNSPGGFYKQCTDCVNNVHGCDALLCAH